MSAAYPIPARSAAREVEAGSSALLMLMGCCTFLNLYCTQSLLPTFEQVFAATKAQVGWTISATTLAVALASPLAGLWVGRADRRVVISGSLAAIALATLAASTAPGLHSLVAWRFVQGLFIPGAYVATMAFIGETWSPRQAGSAMATYVAGNVLGGFAGRMLAGLFAAHGGWREAFEVLGLLDLAGAGLTWAWLSRRAAVVRPAGDAVTLRSLGALLARRSLTSIFAVGFVMLFTLVGLFTYVDFHLAAAPFGLGPAALGCVFMVYLLGVVVTPVAGRWIDRFGFRAVGGVALVVTAAGIGLTLAPVLWGAVLGLAIAACGVFIGQSAATSLLGVLAGPERAPAAGLYLAFYYAGGSFGGVVPALAWSAGGWSACAALLAGSALLSAALMRLTWPARGQVEGL